MRLRLDLLRRLVACGVGGRCVLLGLLASAASCDTATQSECHRRAVDRFGCCPACDAECRAAVSQECAEIHDVPLVEPEALETEGTSTGDDGEPGEPTPQ